MLLKSIALRNIRSYTECALHFPPGITLLAGDIGSGKSTILQAIEFALFGSTKETTGSSLLRNGESNGSIELAFEVEKKFIQIKRTLKRSSASVNQDAGHIIIENRKLDRTATELKQEIITLLNYPQELLNKRSLIYSYTVYTPQEEMKRILFESTEQRLDTLRRVFGIDKYKNIRIATEIFVTSLTGRIKELNAQLSDLDQKLAEKARKDQELRNIAACIRMLEPKLIASKNSVLKQKQTVESLEQQKEALEVLKQEVSILETAHHHKTNDFTKISEQLNKLKQEIKSFENLTREIRPSNKDDLQKKAEELKNIEKKLTETRDKLQEHKILKAHAEHTIQELVRLDVCPVCRQKVSKEHITNITRKEEETKSHCEKQLMLLEKELQVLETKYTEIAKAIDDLKLHEKEQEIIQLKIKNKEEKEQQYAMFQHQFHDLTKELQQLETQKQEKVGQQARYKDLQTNYNIAKKSLEEAQEEERKVEMECHGLKVRYDEMQRSLYELEKEITKLLKKKEQASNLQQLKYWLEELFTNLILKMEKAVMLKVHHDFDALFQKWFIMIMENETLKMRLNEEFTPMVEQNGHEIEYNFLSGGEKTAAALAYRLALNQVINTLVSTIKTHDLIILDEPTDGFSSEQLDRIRLILDELNTQQVIIVSHEAKMESFVDNVIRFEKHNHITSITV